METMQELFYRDPYAREFSATITSCREGKKGFEVVLDDTAFYPEGGGQPSDEGTLGEAKVTFVKRGRSRDCSLHRQASGSWVYSDWENRLGTPF